MATIEEHVRRLVDAAPPLTAEQRHQLRALLAVAPVIHRQPRKAA